MAIVTRRATCYANGGCAMPEPEPKPPLQVLPQPTETTCGPTCLHAVYRHHGEDLPLHQVIADIGELEEGGTLAVLLACHALRRGYRATLYTHNLNLFDPTWFHPGAAVDLAAKLKAQQAYRPRDVKLAVATAGYLDYLGLGGRLLLDDLSPSLLRRYLSAGVPLLAGLSGTCLYATVRERPDGTDDDVGGVPQGHFVLLTDMRDGPLEVQVADPWQLAPSRAHAYWASVDRVINAVLLGVLSYDGNLLALEPPERLQGVESSEETT
jgi:hypothetical protein